MSDLLEEVDDIMRQERMMALWQEHGKTFIGIVVAIILGTAIMSGYKSWDINKRHTDTKNLVALFESENFPANIDEEALKMRSGLKGVALITAAGTLAKEGKNQEALSFFQKAANDHSIPTDLRDLAILSTIRIDTDNENAEKYLEEVWSSNKSPWRFQAHLEAAILRAETQDFGSAREHLKAILDAPGQPETLYKKAQALEKIYALKQYKKSKNENAS